MAVKTLENRAYEVIKELIDKTNPSETFREEERLINRAIISYAGTGRINDVQRRELSTLLFIKNREYAGIKANERLFERIRMRKLLKPGYSNFPYN